MNKLLDSFYHWLFRDLKVSFVQKDSLLEHTVQRGYHLCFLVRRGNLVLNWILKRVAENENLPKVHLVGDSHPDSADAEIMALRPRSVLRLSPFQAREARQQLEQQLEALPVKTILVPVSLFAGKGPKPIPLQLERLSLVPFSELWALAVLIFYRKDLEFEIDQPIPLSSSRREDLNRASRALYKSEKLRRGAIEHSEERVERMILSGAQFEGLLSELSDNELLSYSELKARAGKTLARMRGRTSGAIIVFFQRFLTPIIDRIFEGIEVTGVDELRAQLREQPVVLLPNHRSHFDYLLISYVLYRENLPLPYIAAGENLNFPPVGFFLRRAGAFFIKRRSERDPLYKFILSNYMTYLLKQGHVVEFFVEGGRSRSGLPLQPKFGLLKYLVGAVNEGERKDAALIPVSVTYEKLPEEQAIARELVGEKKASENILGMFRAARILKYRFGSVSVHFGTALAARSIPQSELAQAAVRIVRQQAEAFRLTPLSLYAAAKTIAPHRAGTKEMVETLSELLIALLACRGQKNVTPDTLWDSLPETLQLNVAAAWCLAGKSISGGMRTLVTFIEERYPEFPKTEAIREYYKNQLLASCYPEAISILLGKTSAPFHAELFELFRMLSPLEPLEPSDGPTLLAQFLHDALLAGAHALDLTLQGEEEDIEGESILLELSSPKLHVGFRHYSELVQGLVRAWKDRPREERLAFKGELERLSKMELHTR